MSTRYDIAILGAGESGVGAALLAKSRGLKAFVSDIGAIKSIHKSTLKKNQIDFEEGAHSESVILKSDEVIKSPGIPDSTPIVQKIKTKNISIISEIEFASRFTDAKMIVVTGTNGKTTTTLLTHHLLKTAGFKVALTGNVGKSLAREVAKNAYDYYVVEVSSFQLDGMYEFTADIGILLNITPDHLDRYNFDMSRYVDSKFRITQNMTADNHFIYNFDDKHIREEIRSRELLARLYPISLQNKSKARIFRKGDKLIFIVDTQENQFDINSLPLKGDHNLMNSSAAITAALILGIKEQDILRGLATFKNAPHRMELVAGIEGISFVNDSKATNVESAYYALDTYPSVVWIAGGLDKGNDYTRIRSMVRSKVKCMICLGTDNSRLMEALGDVVPKLFETMDLREAVQMAYDNASKGDTVLLSPACASFDLFNNYEQRGDQFRKEAKRLIKKIENKKRSVS